MSAPRLRRLDGAAVAQLRATVVVRDAAHAVAALVKNAVEADATNVRIRFNATTLQIEVTDDGKGIDEADASVLAERYFTSKAAQRGRGEALASLGDVSRMTVQTCTATGLPWKKTLRFGKTLECAAVEGDKDAAAARQGTRVLVQELCGNLPVRQRRLVASAAEADKVKRVVEEAALTHPRIAFSLTDAARNTLLVHAPRTDDDLHERCRALFGAAIADTMAPVHAQVASPAVGVAGLVAERGFYAKSLQFVFLNGQLVRAAHSPLHKAVNAVFAASLLTRVSDVDIEAAVSVPADLLGIVPASVSVYTKRKRVYQPRRSVDKYGVYVLHVTVPPDLFDVAEDTDGLVVEFEDWAPVTEAVQTAVKDFLRQKNLLPNEAPLEPIDDDSDVDAIEDDDEDDDHRQLSSAPPSDDIEQQPAAASDPTQDDDEDVSSNHNLADAWAAMRSSRKRATHQSRRAHAAFVTQLSTFRSATVDDSSDGERSRSSSPIKRHRPAAPQQDCECAVSEHSVSARNHKVMARFLQALAPPSLPSATSTIVGASNDVAAMEAAMQVQASTVAAQSTNKADTDDEPLAVVRSATLNENSILPPDNSATAAPIPLLFENWLNPVLPTTEAHVTALGVKANVPRQMGADVYMLGHSTLDSSFSKRDLTSVTVMGQIDNKFIACHLDSDTKPTVLLVDQHAAHERIRLERMLQQFSVAGDIETVAVGEPGGVQIDLDANELRTIDTYRASFERWGIHVALHRVAASSAPILFVKRLPKIIGEKVDRAPGIIHDLLKDHAAVLADTHGTSVSMPRVLTRMLNAKACRGAIKFGDPLTMEQCQTLLCDLARCDLPFQCAHGRPSMVPLAVLPSTSSSSAEPRAQRLSLRRLRS